MSRRMGLLKTKAPLVFVYEMEGHAKEIGYSLEQAILEACTQWCIARKDRLPTERIESGGTALEKLEAERMAKLTATVDRLRTRSLQE